MYNQL